MAHEEDQAFSVDEVPGWAMSPFPAKEHRVVIQLTDDGYAEMYHNGGPLDELFEMLVQSAEIVQRTINGDLEVKDADQP